MPLDPAARAFLDAAKDLPQPYEMTIEEFRAAADRLLGTMELEEVASVTDHEIQGGDGQPLTVRVYQPHTEGTRPIVVWVHGGSFTRVRLDHADPMRRTFANLADMVVVAVDQRLSPETRFPGPLQDAYAALRWAMQNPAEISGDAALLGVGGESSGANLAAALPLFARIHGGPPIRFQILVEPLLDATLSCPSARELGDGYILTREQLSWAYEQYAPGIDRHDPLLSPLRAPDLAGLPPAVVVTAEYDPVRDEGEAYAARLAESGVAVKTHRLQGMLHHFPGPEAWPVTAKLTRSLVDELSAAT
jgi:acetyl esterase